MNHHHHLFRPRLPKLNGCLLFFLVATLSIACFNISLLSSFSLQWQEDNFSFLPYDSTEKGESNRNTTNTEKLPKTHLEMPAERIQQVRESICKEAMTEEKLKDWKHLCSGNFVEAATQILMNGDQINVVQIGAHTGFEMNDPIASGLSELLDKVTEISMNNELRKQFHWTFVEPSPANFKRLATNVLTNSNICDMSSINAAVVSDLVKNPDEMIFYSIRDTIDPETGFDSLSNKKFPYWITQVSSFSKKSILRNKNQFVKRGLDINDYIVETNVSTVSFSDLMKEAMRTENNKNKKQEPLLVLIDTEGFDCAIIEGISPSSSFLPKYLVFEHKICKRKETFEHLQSMGYSYHISGENTVAIRN